MFERFASRIENFPHEFASPLPDELLLGTSDDGLLQMHYAPLEYVKEGARVVLCGFAPAPQQAVRALNKARECLREGRSEATALIEAKNAALYEGAMQLNLVRMLNSVGFQEAIGLRTCEQLFTTHRHMLHHTNLLPFPVSDLGTGKTRVPSNAIEPRLKEQLAKEAEALHGLSTFIPMGETTARIFAEISQEIGIDPQRIISGLPSPAPANQERISLFLGASAFDRRNKVHTEVENGRNAALRTIQGLMLEGLG